jgi:hypothetical protein
MITSSQKYTVENLEESITFSVPFRKLWTDIMGAGIYVLISFAIVAYAIFNRSMPASNMAIPAPLIPFLILIFVLLVIELLWLLYGVEILEVSNTRIVIKHRIFGFGLSKRFRSNKVGGVFVSRNKIDDQFFFQLSKGFKPADFTKGMVAINYGKTLFGRAITYRFGANLTEVEAQQIVNLIREKFPQYKYSPVKKTG